MRATFDLGTDAKPWRVVYAAEFNNGVIPLTITLSQQQFQMLI